ncbi:MAG: ABC transporter permease, partial [bacterium]
LSGFFVRTGQGRFLGQSEDSDLEAEVVLGKGLAKSLKTRPGDYLTLMTTTVSGALNAVDVKVVGTFSTGVPEYDSRALMVRLDVAQDLMVTDRVSKIVVVLRDTEMTDAVYADLQRLFPNLAVKRWIDLAPYYRSVVGLYNSIFAFLGVIIFVVVVLSSSNTMMMSIFERTREIGTLLAVGTSRGRMVVNFLYEGVIIGLVGGGLGVALAAGLSYAINHAGINMPPPPGYDQGYPLLVYQVPGIIAGAFVLMVGTTVLSTIFPALRAARMKIVDALGHV